MSLHIERQGDVVIVMPNGPLNGDERTRELETALRKLIYEDQKKIILDLAKTPRIDSIGIGVLAGVHTSAVNHNVKLHVCNIERRIKDLLAIVMLLRVLKCFDTREEALAAFGE